MDRILSEAGERILILDGAVGTMIQPLLLEEKDFRNHELLNHPVELKGNNDLLNITRPDIIQNIHRAYIEAGADILSTNTFSANRVSQRDYKTENLVYEMNFQGARLTKRATAEYNRTYPYRKVFVAGAMGSTTRLASISPGVNDAGKRAVHFDELAAVYAEQAKALIAGGVDLFLLETVTDTLNIKAALYSLMQVFETYGCSYPIMVSATIADASGRILSGQTIEAFLVSVSHAPLLSVGLNCASGAAELGPYLQRLSNQCPFLVSVHPNAGRPNQFGGYDQTPGEFGAYIREFATNGWLNIAGGCCGTTPSHISAAAAAVKDIKPRKIPLSNLFDPKTMTDYKTVSRINSWKKDIAENGAAIPSLNELITLVSRIEDEQTFEILKQTFTEQKHLYHPEQALLINAHLWGRQQHLRSMAQLQRQV